MKKKIDLNAILTKFGILPTNAAANRFVGLALHTGFGDKCVW